MKGVYFMKKRILLLVSLLLLLSLVLYGCSSGGNSSKQASPPSEQTDQNQEQGAENEAEEDPFPEKEIEILLPGSPGGSMDATARAIAEIGQKPEYFGVPIVVRNNPGGSMTFAAEKMMEAEADGYTLHVGGESQWAIAPINMDVGYDPIEDIAYIGRLNVMYSGWAVPADSPFQTVEDLLNYVKEHPGEVSMGVGGGTFQLWQDILEERGYVFNNVTFEGGAEVAPQLAGGHIDVGGLSVLAAKPLVESGDIRMLFWGPVIEGKEPPIEGVPTMKDHPVLQELEPLAVYNGVTINAKVPENRKKFIEETLAKIAQDEKFQEMMKNLGVEPIWVGSEEYTQAIHDYINLAKEIYSE
jgi:tripartite-type tricarboxylate transporter receptor subunit TctC